MNLQYGNILVYKEMMHSALNRSIFYEIHRSVSQYHFYTFQINVLT